MKWLLFPVTLILLAGCGSPGGTQSPTTGPTTSSGPEPEPTYIRWQVGLNVTVVNYANQEEGVPQVNQNCVIGGQDFGEDLLAIHANATAGGGNMVDEWTLRVEVNGSENRTVLQDDGHLPLSVSYREANFTGDDASFSIEVLPGGSPVLAAQEKIILDLVFVTRNPMGFSLERERILSCG